MGWLDNFYFGYWWPSIKGNGPEDVTSLIVAAAVTVVLVPAVRHWLERHLHSELRHLHAKLDHVILHHPDIPNRVPGVPDSHQPTPAGSPDQKPPASPGST